MKRYVLIIILSILVIGGLAYYFATRTKTDETTTADYFSKAEEYFKDKQYSNALEQYKQSINADPSNTDAYVKAASIYMLKAKYDEAFQLLKNGESIVENPDMVHYLMGKILIEKNDLEGALKYLEEANSQNPDNWENTISLVKTYSYYPDRKDKALTALNKIGIDEGIGFVYKNYYLALLSYDNIGSVLTYLAKASPEAEGDLKTNIDNFISVATKVQNDPEDLVQNYTLLAYELIRAELYHTAIPLLEKVISENDEYYAAYMYAGVCYMNMNSLDKALEYLSKSSNIEPNEIQPRLFLAQVYTLQNNQQQAIDTYEDALNIDKENETLRFDYAKTLIRFDLFRQARLEYQELIELNTENLVRYKIELALLDLDHMEDSKEGLRLAKEVVENWEDFQTADTSLQAKALDALGWAYQKNQQKDEALKYLKRALEIDKYLPSAYYHLGVIYAEIENYTEAKGNFERAIDLDLDGTISSKAANELEKLSASDKETQ